MVSTSTSESDASVHIHSIIPVLSSQQLEEFSQKWTRAEKLGEGSYGLVWKVLESETKMPFAMKVMELGEEKSHMAVSMEREVEVMEMIKTLKTPSPHPGYKYLVRLEEAAAVAAGANEKDSMRHCESWLKENPERGWGKLTSEEWSSIDRVIFIRMEFCDAGTLHHWLMKTEPLSPSSAEKLEEGKNLFSNIVDGLAFLQALVPHVIHRDLKPDNIMLKITERGNKIAKIGDFGLARQRRDEGGSVVTVGLGAALYQAPEAQAESKIEMTYKSDIFSLGLILFFIFERSQYRQKQKIREKVVLHIRRKSDRVLKYCEILSSAEKATMDLVWMLTSHEPDKRPRAEEIRSLISQIWWGREASKLGDRGAKLPQENVQPIAGTSRSVFVEPRRLVFEKLSHKENEVEVRELKVQTRTFTIKCDACSFVTATWEKFEEHKCDLSPSWDNILESPDEIAAFTPVRNSVLHRLTNCNIM